MKHTRHTQTKIIEAENIQALNNEIDTHESNGWCLFSMEISTITINNKTTVAVIVSKPFPETTT